MVTELMRRAIASSEFDNPIIVQIVTLSRLRHHFVVLGSFFFSAVSASNAFRFVRLHPQVVYSMSLIFEPASFDLGDFDFGDIEFDEALLDSVEQFASQTTSGTWKA